MTQNHLGLFYNQGLIPTLILTKNDGKIVVNSGLYDGISDFYGKYALVSVAGKIGLIDSLGQEVISPQDLNTGSINLIDSLNIINKEIEEKNEKENQHQRMPARDLPVEYKDFNKKCHPDNLSLNIEQRNTLWRLMLSKSIYKNVKTASDMYIERANLKVNDFFYTRSHYTNSQIAHYSIRVTASANTYAFVFSDNEYFNANSYKFYNFHYKNNRWEELQINDILQIQGDKRWLFNDLITKKVKALKDQQIDCSNTAAFVTTVENRFMLTKEGIDFCFNSTEGNEKLVIISFIWAELQPFLKMKIGNQ